MLLIPIQHRIKWQQPPLMCLLLIVINTLCFLLFPPGADSAIQFGLIPAEKTIGHAFTSLFMHGSVSHLLGNMIFLFLFGFAMEVMLGKLRFLLIYLAAGICAGWTFCLFNEGSTVPLVGASGAISGLMGMYVAAYGFKRIRLFYSLVFWFGEFTAPALMVLPIWVGKELFEQIINSHSNVAYIAHAGGIVSGFLLTWVAIRFHAPVDETHYSSEKNNVEEEAFNKRMLRANQQLSRMDMGNAKKTLQGLMKDFPERHEPWERLFNIVCSDREASDYHELVQNMFKRALDDSMPVSMLIRVLKDYKTASQEHPALAEVECLLLAERFIQDECMDEADYVLKRALNMGCRKPPMADCVSRMQVYSGKSGQQKKQAFYAEKLRRLEGGI